MEKPKPKTELAIGYHDESLRWICLTASQDSVIGLEEFGDLGRDVIHSERDGFMLIVDRRYDFREVLEYIRSLQR